MSDTLYSRRFVGSCLDVYADRVEYRAPMARPLIFPLAQIYTVVAQAKPPRLVLTTTAGQIYTWPFGIVPDLERDVAAIEAARAPLIAGQPAPRQTKIKEYKSAKEFEADAIRMQADGWHLEDQVAQAGHINVGRTATGAVLTGGLSLLLGASRTKDKIVVTWVRGGEAETKVCPQCAEEVKAAAKICRFCQYKFETE